MGRTAAGGASSVSVNAVTDAASCRVLYWRMFLPESWDAATGGGRPARCRAGTAVARPRPTVTGVPTHPHLGGMEPPLHRHVRLGLGRPSAWLTTVAAWKTLFTQTYAGRAGWQ